MKYLLSSYCSSAKVTQNRPCTTASLQDRLYVSGLIVLFKHALGPKDVHTGDIIATRGLSSSVIRRSSRLS